MDDPNDTVKRNAAYYLGEIGDDRAVLPILQAVDKYPKAFKTGLIIDTLSKIGGKNTLAILADKLQKRNSNSDILAIAAGVLGYIGGPEVVDSLIDALKYPDPQVEAAKSLGMICDQRALEPLIAALREPGSIYYRMEAVVALGNLRDRRAIQPLKEMIGATLKDDEKHIRNYAIDSLGKIGGSEVVDFLLPMLEDPDQKINVAGALGETKDGRAISALLSLLDASDNSDYRCAAVIALGNFVEEQVFQRLIKTLAEDKSSNVRAAAALSLGKIADRRALEPLIKALSDPAPHKEEIKRSNDFCRITGVSFCVNPDKYLTESRYDVRSAAIVALGQIGDSRAIEPLAAKFPMEKDFNRRIYIAEALGRIQDKRAAETLDRLLSTVVGGTEKDALRKSAGID